MCVKDHCSGMEMKLTAWKAKLFDVICKTDKMGSKDKEKAMASINDIKIIIMDIEAKIDKLKTECPSEFSPQKKKIDAQTIDMRSIYDESMEFTGNAVHLSVQD